MKMKGSAAEEEMKKLRSTATELLLREDWKEYINLYSRFLASCNFSQTSPIDDDYDPVDSAKLRRALCCALSNCAEAQSRLRNLSAALNDCDRALTVDPVHLKSLVCKGKLLLDLHRYSQASDCFRRAAALSDANNSAGNLSQLLGRAQKLEAQSKTGAVDLSDWVANGFVGNCPELAEYVGPVDIRPSEAGGGRGLFATKSVEAGDLVVSKIDLFKPECSVDQNNVSIPVSKGKEVDVQRILKVLDVNCLTEEALSAKVLGKKKDSCSVGLWLLPSFVNHSCCPNARRLHVGDRVVVHASRDIKSGEEITFAYFDVLQPLGQRREMAKRWGFLCSCARCRFEETRKKDLAELLCGISTAGDAGKGVVARVENMVRMSRMKEKEKGFVRASFWMHYAIAYGSEMRVRNSKGRIPAEILVAENIHGVVGGDERLLKTVMWSCKKRRDFVNAAEAMEMETIMKLARGVYGKVMKNQAMKAFVEVEFAGSSK
ncbi:hypothetical protein HPP92_007672 [Vanilla planifolia]|uniref:SET domain-containing protein n=1 Tax=Vanilla planifolia TaxID=51239 RepID=A0A835V7X5_VANPL|nr:hypothetical protein HPP92_007672 [Vanilla planifolia]